MVESGAAAVSGHDAASQDNGTSVEVSEYLRVYAKPSQPLEEEELLSCCLIPHLCDVTSSDPC